MVPQFSSDKTRSGMRVPRRLSSIKDLSPALYKSIRLCSYTAIIWIVCIIGAILCEKIYKTPYISNSNPKSVHYFNDPFGIPLFHCFFGMFYGFLKYQIANRNQEASEREEIPFKQYLKVCFLDVSILLLVQIAIIMSSFTTFNIINSCSFLSAVIVGVFCSKYRAIFFNIVQSQQNNDSTRVKPTQIVIATIVVIGIIIFNIFAIPSSFIGVNQPLNVWSSSVILILLILEGFRPELIMQIRQNYHPRPSYLYYQIAKYSFILLLIISAVSTHLFSLLAFVWDHDELAQDLILLAFLTVIGQIFIFRVLVLHKQHIIPFICTLRKIITSVINILWFHHQISNLQILGLGVVVFGVGVQLLDAYLQIKGKNQQSKEIEAKFQQIQQEIEEDTF